MATPKVNLQGHCVICLNRRPNLGINLKNLEVVFEYLTGVKENDRGLPAFRDLPPICAQCRLPLIQLEELHQEMVEIQDKMNTKANLIRDVVLGTREDKSTGVTERQIFGESLMALDLPPNQVQEATDYVDKLHSQIISQVGEQVGFSASPSSNLTVPFKQPKAQQVAKKSTSKPYFRRRKCRSDELLRLALEASQKRKNSKLLQSWSMGSEVPGQLFHLPLTAACAPATNEEPQRVETDGDNKLAVCAGDTEVHVQNAHAPKENEAETSEVMDCVAPQLN